MRIVWYVLALILGAIGAVAFVRAVERTVYGGGSGGAGVIGVQLLIGLLCMAGAWKSLRKARKK